MLSRYRMCYRYRYLLGGVMRAPVLILRLGAISNLYIPVGYYPQKICFNKLAFYIYRVETCCFLINLVLIIHCSVSLAFRCSFRVVTLLYFWGSNVFSLKNKGTLLENSPANNICQLTYFTLVTSDLCLLYFSRHNDGSCIPNIRGDQ